MGEAKQSRTAQGVAVERALLAGMGVIDDPFARGMLSPPMSAMFRFAQRWPDRVLARSVTLAGLAARVLWHDSQVTKSLDAGITQVAVVGAGYDSRAWRLHRDGVQFLELDQGSTQQDKMRRAPGPGPTYVEADLRIESAAKALLEHGLDASRPTHFIVEGLTMYLTEENVRRQFDELQKSSAVGSRLAADFYPPRDAGTAQDHRQLRLQRLARAGSGETIMLGVDPPGAAKLVEASGWDVTEATSMREAALALVRTDSGLPVDAISEHKSLVAASHS